MTKPHRYSFNNANNDSRGFNASNSLYTTFTMSDYHQYISTQTNHSLVKQDYFNHSPHHTSFSLYTDPQRWTIRTWCLICIATSVGILAPFCAVSYGIVSFDSFIDIVRYTPGYIYFANNFLFILSFLLLTSFAVLACYPTIWGNWKMNLLGCPLHILIVFIFRRLLREWIPWCLASYSLMALLPFAYTAFSLLKGLTFQRLGFYSSALQQSSCLRAFAVLERGIETLLMWVSYTNRSSSWPRFWIGCLLVLSFIVPVVIQNEPRNFNPAFADPQFQILQPEPLCPAPLFQGPGGGGGRLQGFEETAHDDGDEGNGTTQGTKTFDEYWKEYVEFHKQMVLPEHLGGIPHKSKNFLVFTPSDDGLGNRLQALLSTVVLAMVTKRAIVLDWRATPQCKAEFLDLFQQPDGIAWDFWSVWNRNPDTHANHQRSTPVTIPGEWLPYCRGCLLRDPITPSSMWSRMLCGTDLGVDESQPWKEIISTQWFLPVIQHNPIWRAELCRMFPEGDHKNAFQLLAKKILRPSATVQSQIDSVLTRIPRDVTTLIGLQVRRTENNAAGGYNIEESFLTCADQVVDEEIERSDRAWMARQKQKGRHQKQRIDDGNIKNRAPTTVYNRLPTELEEMWIEREKRKNQPKFAYILATDYHPTRLHFQEILGDELYVLENTFQSATATAHGRQQRQQQHDDHDEQQQLQQQEQQQLQQQQKQQQHLSTANTIDSSHRIGLLKHSNQLTSNTSSAMDAKSTTQNSQRAVVARNSVQGVQMAVAEMFLLAHADRIIASPYSTFGYFAHGYANVQPNIVKRDGTCIHRKSTQPCFQYWFGFANGGASCPIKATIEMSEDYDCWL